RSDSIGERVIAEDAPGRGRGGGFRAAHAIDVIGPGIIEYAARHVVHLIVRIRGRLCGPTISHWIVLKGVGKLTAASVEGAAAHGIKLPVSWEKDPNRADVGTRHVRTGCPTAVRGSCCWRRCGGCPASHKIELPDALDPIETAPT